MEAVRLIAGVLIVTIVLYKVIEAAVLSRDIKERHGKDLGNE